MEKNWERFAKVVDDRLMFGDELVYSKSTQSKGGVNSALTLRTM
jgi:hypothetical protein